MFNKANGIPAKIFLVLAAALLAQNAGAWGAVWELSTERDAKEWARRDDRRIYSATHKGMHIPIRHGVLVNQDKRSQAISRAMSNCNSVMRTIKNENRERGGVNEVMHCRVDHVFRKECVALGMVALGYKVKGPNKFFAAFGETRRIYTAAYIEQFWSGKSKATKWYKKDVKKKAQRWCDKSRNIPKVPGNSKGSVHECGIREECDWWWNEAGNDG